MPSYGRIWLGCLALFAALLAGCTASTTAVNQPPPVPLSPGFHATGTFPDGSQQQLSSVTWSVSRFAPASISNAAGSAGNLAAGEPANQLLPVGVTVTATDGSMSGSASAVLVRRAH